MRRWLFWTIIASLGLLLAVGVTLFNFFIFPIAIHYQVTKTLALENGTEAWDRFMVTPVPIILKLYFFKVDNPEDIMRGVKPRVSEVGPYVYREMWKKEEVRVDEASDSIFYRQGIEFVFDRNMSGGLSDLDYVTTINPIIHLISQIMNGLRPTLDLIEEMLEYGLPELMGDWYGPTVTVRVRDLLFDGVVIPCNRTELGYGARLLCSALRHWATLDNLYTDNTGNVIVSILKFKELGPTYQMSRGNRGGTSLGRILTVDGERSYSAWWCDSANYIEGYDMVMFPPFVTPSTRIPFVSTDIKSTISLVYKEESSYQGIDGYRFQLDFSFLGDVREDPAAGCYCPGSAKNLTIPNPCYPGKGILELSSPLGLPAILSLPHFYQASDNWLSQVDGLDPQPFKHESYLDIEPTTGVPLRGYKRVQVNVMTKALSSVKLLQNHVNALIPLVWLEEGSSLGPKEVDMFQNQLLYVLHIVRVIRWTLFGAGMAVLIGAGGMAVWRKRQGI